MEMLRPGFNPLSRKEISNKLLEDALEEEQECSKTLLEGKTVRLGPDDW